MRANAVDCYPPFADLVVPLFAKIQTLLDLNAPATYRAELVETSRSVEDQLAAVARGASRAPPEKAPHCIRTKDGRPCAMAADFWILERQTGNLAPDGALIWAVIPLAAYQVAKDQLSSGAFFKTIPGGDWPHLEWRGWYALTDGHGILVE